MHEREMGEDWYRDDRFIIVKRKKAPKPTPPAGLLPLTHSIYLCILSLKFILLPVMQITNHVTKHILLSSVPSPKVISQLWTLEVIFKVTRRPSSAPNLVLCVASRATEMHGRRQVCRTSECWRPRTMSRTTDTNLDFVLVNRARCTFDSGYTQGSRLG